MWDFCSGDAHSPGTPGPMKGPVATLVPSLLCVLVGRQTPTCVPCCMALSPPRPFPLLPLYCPASCHPPALIIYLCTSESGTYGHWQMSHPPRHVSSYGRGGSQPKPCHLDGQDTVGKLLQVWESKQHCMLSCKSQLRTLGVGLQPMLGVSGKSMPSWAGNRDLHTDGHFLGNVSLSSESGNNVNIKMVLVSCSSLHHGMQHCGSL